MDVTVFLRRSKVLVVVGKGGVGKTTTTAALASLAARAGLDVLVVALDDTAGLAALLDYGDGLGYDEVVVRAPASPPGEPGENRSPGPERVPGRVRARVLTSDAALTEYLAAHGLGRFAARLVRTGALDVVAMAIPGIREVLILGKVRQLEVAGTADLIVLDAPATGHALSFLSSSGGLADAARGGPLRAQADQVVAMLTDPDRCQVLLVTIPEETPVNEAVETAFRIEDEIGVTLGPVVVNCCYPVLHHLDDDPAEAAAAAGAPPPEPGLADSIARAAAFRRGRQRLQEAQLARLAERLPLPTIKLPYLFTAGVGVAELGRLVAALAAGIAALP
ncbi:MAG: ArsA-related P-loop ATPase [Acidimicrobiales bacterium]|jgi:anion-transporting  ArsA/GET3 family ATPase